MKSKMIEVGTPIANTNREEKRCVWHILLITLAPLYLLAIIGAIVFALVMLDRHFISLTNFLLQQKIFILVMIFGVVVAIIIFTLSVMYALRKIGILRQSGQALHANAGLIVLAIVASILVFPIVLALFFH